MSAGNVCDNPKCKGKLKDTIINFGQDLPEGMLSDYVHKLINGKLTNL